MSLTITLRRRTGWGRLRRKSRARRFGGGCEAVEMNVEEERMFKIIARSVKPRQRVRFGRASIAPAPYVRLAARDHRRWRKRYGAGSSHCPNAAEGCRQQHPRDRAAR